MPAKANRIVVEWTEAEGFKCRVWDAQGQETDVTRIFDSVSGATGVGRVWTEFRCSCASVITRTAFKALGKELTFDVQPQVVAQILQIHG